MNSLLSPLLSKQQCAACRFCCTFAKFEAWETPLFTEPQIEQLAKKYGAFPVKNLSSMVTFDLSVYWDAHGDAAYAPCPFLSTQNGCRLTDDEKPFDCKIWPLRVMRRTDGTSVIALTPTCPEINKLPLTRIKQFVQGDAGTTIIEKTRQFPGIIKEYREGFPVLRDITALLQERQEITL